MAGSGVKRRAIVGAVTALCAVFAIACGWDYLRPVDLVVGKQSTDLIIVEKAAHRMILFSHGRVQRVYSVALGRGGAGPKTIAGDNKVPEGSYRIVGRNPQSAFHLSLRVGYPTRAQSESAARNGVDPGGDVMIHGIRNGLGWIGRLHREVDWTRGCIAVTNPEIEEIWRNVPNGATITIRP